ncbi:MAG: hypothetical protein VKJ63_07125 [Synechococcus sp.]|nr:hypothetical protein [Synechococcus sp.]
MGEHWVELGTGLIGGMDVSPVWALGNLQVHVDVMGLIQFKRKDKQKRQKTPTRFLKQHVFVLLLKQIYCQLFVETKRAVLPVSTLEKR